MLDTIDILSLGLSLIPIVVYCVGFSIYCKTENYEVMMLSGLIDTTLLTVCFIMLVMGVVLEEAIISGIMMAIIFFGKEDVKYNNYEKYRMMYETIYSYSFVMFFITALKYVY